MYNRFLPKLVFKDDWLFDSKLFITKKSRQEPEEVGDWISNDVCDACPSDEGD